MERESNLRLDSIENEEGKEEKVRFVETMNVKEGVVCDVYEFPGDPTKDLGIIKIQPGQSTPLQKILGGDITIEGHISGKGQLIIRAEDDSMWVYSFDDDMKDDEKRAVEVKIGYRMQWNAAPDSELTVYEICFPPYEDGRFENLPEQLPHIDPFNKG